MRGIDRISAFAPLDLTTRGETLALHNVERVRSFLEENLGCKQKEVVRELDLSRRTVGKAIKIIRGQS